MKEVTHVITFPQKGVGPKNAGEEHNKTYAIPPSHNENKATFQKQLDSNNQLGKNIKEVPNWENL